MRDSTRGFGREFHRFFGYEATPEPSARNRNPPRWMKRKRQIFLSPASVAASIRNPYGTVKRLLLTHQTEADSGEGWGLHDCGYQHLSISEASYVDQVFGYLDAADCQEPE